MRIEEGDEDASEDAGESIEHVGESIEPITTDGEAREKVIVRSNGVVTYVGKDIANQFWKFGLLGRDFRYRRFATQADGRAAVVDDVRRTASRRRRPSARPAASTT